MGRDSNPRDPFGAHTLSRRAPSTARPPILNELQVLDTGAEGAGTGSGSGCSCSFCTCFLYLMFSNGQGEIRTHETLASPPVFETGAFNHSATCPRRRKATEARRRMVAVATCGHRGGYQS